jgi:hypothetical protein
VTFAPARLAHTLLDNGVTEFATHNPDFESFGFERVFDPLPVATR